MVPWAMPGLWPEHCQMWPPQGNKIPISFFSPKEYHWKRWPALRSWLSVLHCPSLWASSFFRSGSTPSCRLPSFPPSYTRGLHSRRSSLAHVNECRFYLETWPLVTAPWRISRQTLTNICLEWVCPVFFTQTQESFSTTQGWTVVGWSWSFMLVVQELCPLRMAEDGGGEEAELPECNCDVTRQASPRLSCLCIVSCYVWGWLDGHWKLKYWVVPREHGMFVISSSQDAYKWLLGLFPCLLTRHTALAGKLDGLCVGLWCQLSLQCDGGGVGIMLWLMDWESRKAQKRDTWIHT